MVVGSTFVKLYASSVDMRKAVRHYFVEGPMTRDGTKWGNQASFCGSWNHMNRESSQTFPVTELVRIMRFVLFKWLLEVVLCTSGVQVASSLLF